MDRCWASSLGDCGDKLSREHLISEGLFAGQEVRVQGLPWCKDEPVIIGLSSLVAKVLCAKHNSELSPVDEAGAAAFKLLGNAAGLQLNRSKLKSQRWHVHRDFIDGPLLERWFLKTTINLSLAQRTGLRWALTDSPVEQPSELLVASAFGRASLPPPMGLYSAAVDGARRTSDNTVDFVPLIKNGTHLAGGAFAFRGDQFLLSAIPEQLPAIIDFVAQPGWQDAANRFQLRHFRYEVGGHLSQTITFKWPRSVA